MATQDIFNAVMAFDEDKVKQLTKAEVAAGTEIGTILNQGLIGAMDTVGEKFSAGDLFVPEMLMAAQAMKAGLEILKPLLSAGQAKARGRVVIGTVKGDLHDIGKNLVSMMMEGAGFDVIDLGVDVASEKFVQVAAEKKADVIALSALLTTTMPAMQSDGNGSEGGGVGEPHDHRRGAGDPGVCRPDRCRRLQPGCARRGQAGQEADGLKYLKAYRAGAFER